jgi:MYXO-CTERM domain-containing protein
MRKCMVIVALVGAFFASSAQAGFVVTTSRAPITSGLFAGKDAVTLFIRNDGNTTGTDIIYYDVNVAGASGVVNPQFFIRTWDGTIHNPNASLNTKADLGWQGFVPGDATRNGAVDIFDLNTLLPHFNTTGNTWTTGDFNGDGNTDIFDLNVLLPNFNTTFSPGSYVRFGSPAQFDYFFPVGFVPAENSQTFTDGQSISGFEVTSLVINPTTSGLDDTVATQLAVAVVPTGQGVTFSGSAAAHQGNTATFSITDAGGPLTPAAVPEPAALGLLSLGALFLRRTRN